MPLGNSSFLRFFFAHVVSENNFLGYMFTHSWLRIQKLLASRSKIKACLLTKSAFKLILSAMLANRPAGKQISNGFKRNKIEMEWRKVAPFFYFGSKMLIFCGLKSDSADLILPAYYRISSAVNNNICQEILLDWKVLLYHKNINKSKNSVAPTPEGLNTKHPERHIQITGLWGWTS